MSLQNYGLRPEMINALFIGKNLYCDSCPSTYYYKSLISKLQRGEVDPNLGPKYWRALTGDELLEIYSKFTEKSKYLINEISKKL